jgi:15-cis-phytoene synthase
MNAEFLHLSPPKHLALAYARTDLRDFLGVLLRLDDRMAAMLVNNQEVLIGQMRIAWWNDVIAKPAHARPKGEPLLALLGAVEAAGQGEQARSSCLQLLEAWEVLLVDEDRLAITLDTHAKLRGAAIFGGYARLAGAAEAEIAAVVALGAYWAAQQSHTAPRLPRALRPLSILAKAAALEQTGNKHAGLSLTWHALTGR